MNRNEFPDLNLNELKLNNKISSYLNYQKLLKNSKDTDLDGQTWFILACGPSLSMFENDDKFKALLDKHPVITIKQAGNQYENFSNIHIFNEVRYDNSFNNIGNYRFSVSEFQSGSRPHIHFPIKSYKLDDSLFRTNKYKENELLNSYRRPWGVGVLFELAIFIPVLFHCKRIVLVGVDMNEQGNYHFYDNSNEQHSKSYKVDDFEFYFTKGTSYYMDYWLKKKNIDLLNLSPLSDLPIKKVHNIDDLEEILSL